MSQGSATFVVTIDGPAGSGKTTTARHLAGLLGFDLLESGAFYRFLTHFLLEEYGQTLTLFFELEEAVMRGLLERALGLLEVRLSPQGTELWYKGRLLKEELRREDVEEWVSKVSALPVVRDLVNAYLRELVKGRRIVAEGRDMGSVVFPFADVKFYLTARESIRAERRRKDLGNVDLNEVKTLLNKRDELDSTRKVAPLTVPESATVIDNSDLSLDEVVALMERQIRERLKGVSLRDG